MTIFFSEPAEIAKIIRLKGLRWLQWLSQARSALAAERFYESANQFSQY